MLATNSKILIALVIASFALNSSFLLANVCEADALTKINNDVINKCNKKTWGDHDDNIKCFQKQKVSNSCANCFADLSECAYNSCVGFGSPCGFKGTKRKSENCTKCVQDSCAKSFTDCSGLPSVPR